MNIMNNKIKDIISPSDIKNILEYYTKIYPDKSFENNYIYLLRNINYKLKKKVSDNFIKNYQKRLHNKNINLDQNNFEFNKEKIDIINEDIKLEANNIDQNNIIDIVPSIISEMLVEAEEDYKNSMIIDYKENNMNKWRTYCILENNKELVNLWISKNYSSAIKSFYCNAKINKNNKNQLSSIMQKYLKNHIGNLKLNKNNYFILYDNLYNLTIFTNVNDINNDNEFLLSKLNKLYIIEEIKDIKIDDIFSPNNNYYIW